MIVDREVARLAKLERAAVGQRDHGMAARTGDYSVANIDRCSSAGGSGRSATLELNAAARGGYRSGNSCRRLRKSRRCHSES
jgi:hypothetical protein